MIRALLFDFDGLILDTEVPAFRSWQEIYREFGVELQLEEWSAALGTVGGFDPIGHLESITDLELDREALTARRRARKRELVAAEELRPGIADYVSDAGRLGLKLAIVTSDTADWVTANLRPFGLTDRWDCIHCADGDATRAKPEPDLYVAALEELGVQASDAIAFEDSPNGIGAAKGAGLFCVAVPNDLTKNLDLSRADLIIESLADLFLPELLEVASG